MKKVLSLLLMVLYLNSGTCFSLEYIDDSIDKSLRDKYDTKKIETDLLPELPKNLPDFDDNIQSDADIFAPSAAPPQKAADMPAEAEQTQKPPVTNVSKTPATPPAVQEKPAVQTKPAVTKTTQKTAATAPKISIKMPKGKKFKVRITSQVSDRTPAGTRLSFVSRYPETATYVTIPSGTVFKGKVTDSHPPNITGNGGLIVIEVDEMVYKGKTYKIDAKISVANEKRIFFNNIKGKHQFWKGLVKSTTPGYNFFKKMWRCTCKYWKNDNGVEILLTPITFVSGTVVYVLNIAASPVLAIFSKGGSITIPKNADFVIQLREDINI